MAGRQAVRSKRRCKRAYAAVPAGVKQMLGHGRREASLRGLPRSAQGSQYGRGVVRFNLLELPSNFLCSNRGRATLSEALSERGKQLYDLPHAENRDPFYARRFYRS